MREGTRRALPLKADESDARRAVWTLRGRETFFFFCTPPKPRTHTLTRGRARARLWSTVPCEEGRQEEQEEEETGVAALLGYWSRHFWITFFFLVERS